MFRNHIGITLPPCQIYCTGSGRKINSIKLQNFHSGPPKSQIKLQRHKYIYPKMIPCHVLELLYAGAEPASFRRIKPKLKQHSICRLTANQYIRDLVPSRGRCFSYDGLSQHYVDTIADRRHFPLWCSTVRNPSSKCTGRANLITLPTIHATASVVRTPVTIG